MSDQIKTLIRGDSLPVEPVGLLASGGWIPGTWVKYTNDSLSFSGAQATVDVSDGTGVLAGFLITGPQHSQPMLLQSDMWRDDVSRPGGDSYKDWTAFDSGAAWAFDNSKLLQREGTRIVTMVVPASGAFKTYVFETQDLAERTNVGTGSSLVYAPGDKIFVSNRGYFTKEQESIGHGWTEYVIFRTGQDREGLFLNVISGKGA